MFYYIKHRLRSHSSRRYLLYIQYVLSNLPGIQGSSFYILFFFFGWAGSQFLRASFLQLQSVATLVACVGSSCGPQALGAWVSVVVTQGLISCGSWALEHGLSSYGSQAWLLCNMWHLPRPGIEPVSPALAGRFLPSVLTRKSYILPFRAYSVVRKQVHLFTSCIGICIKKKP